MEAQSVMQMERTKIRELVVHRLAPRLAQSGLNAVQDDTNLAELLIADSADLLDIIVFIEEETGIEFNPDGLDVERGITLAQLVGAFGETFSPVG
jgi:acyl carrier protein